MKRIYIAYKELLHILFLQKPYLVIITFVSAILSGLITPLSIWVNSRIFDLGLLTASGEMAFFSYIPYLVLFVLLSLLPVLVGDILSDSYIRPRCQLIFRTVYKGKMLQKLKTLRYEHLESPSSMEIIDKAYSKTENVLLTLFPTTPRQILSAGIAAVGTLCLFAAVKWWLFLVILLPFALETWFVSRSNYHIYNEMETYWKKERFYTRLGEMLRSRDYVRENTLQGISDYLIDQYRSRMNSRNREYEHYFFKHLRHNLVRRNLTRFAQLSTALLLLFFYCNGEIQIGSLISLSLALFTKLFSQNGLNGLVKVIRASGQHRNAFAFYDSYFRLSEEEDGREEAMPDTFEIEFDNVSFAYPGTEKKILDGMSFRIRHGEKVSIVGENGQGKSTVIKLLLGLFRPDSGEIRIGGKPLECYSRSVREHLFGAVFQDFGKYCITLGENVGIGAPEKLHDREVIAEAMGKAGVESVAAELANGADTLLGREFEGGVDLSGGQWQRIAIARALMGKKPVMILDEPTSQLDPMAESRIYSEFAEMTEGKTAVFVTHRLASTMITDRILVVGSGRVIQSGSHEELLEQGGLYADMFRAQQQWYVKRE